MGIIAKIDYGYFLLEKSNNLDSNYCYLLEDGLKLPNGMTFQEYHGKENGNDVIHLISSDIDLPLYVRSKKVGDAIELKGMNKFKKVSDIFIDKKLSRDKRDSYPIVVDSSGKIIWIPKLKKSKYDSQNHELCDIIFKCL